MNNVRVSTLAKLGFALLVLLSTFVALPAPVAASCGSATNIHYFHDAAKTQFCGYCIYWCDGYVECSDGVESCPYSKLAKPIACPC